MNAKAASQRYQRQLLELAKVPGNDVCADCRGRNPRWASHNLGIFLCVQCAGIHRKMGTHISKVKSLTLDEWNREQVECMKSLGNARSNDYYNPDEKRNRPPANVENGERDSDLERFIRNKYEHRKFMNKLPPPLPVKDEGPRRSISPRPYASRGTGQSRPSNGHATLSPPGQIPRSRTAPIVPSTWKEAKRAASPLPALPPEATSSINAATAGSSTMPSISISASPASAPGPQQQQQQQQRSTTMPVQQHQLGVGLPSTSAPGLYPSAPSLPLRASSAQGLSGPGSNGLASSSAIPSPNHAFEGRSSVFDDLLGLSSPAQPQGSSYGGGTWPLSQQPQVQVQPPAFTGGMQMNNVNVGNPWAAQQQAASTSVPSPFHQQPVSMDATGLGNMAFGQQSWPAQPFAGQMQMQTQPSYATPGAGGTFGGFAPNTLTASPAPRSPSNPFFQVPQQQPSPQTHFQTPYGSGQPLAAGAAPQHQPQHHQQPHDPYFAQQTMAQQRLNSGQVFDDWTKNMMPSRR
ncbi:unnamed protein product [Parajaminaea phylloscopi]